MEGHNFFGLYMYVIDHNQDIVTMILRMSRGRCLLLGGNPKGYEVAEHIARQFKVNSWMISTLKNARSI